MQFSAPPVNTDKIAKAWVNIDGTGTVNMRASHNVSSVTDIGLGSYQVNFEVPMLDSNYAVCGSSKTSGSGSGYFFMIKSTGLLSTHFNLLTVNSAGDSADSDELSCIVFGGS